MDPDEVLARWDRFVERRSLPYYRDDHKRRMRDLLRRFPFAKFRDLSDGDLVGATGDARRSHLSGPRRGFRFFLTHLDEFLALHDIQRRP